MSTNQEFDCVVIGAGVQGSFAAYQLAKHKQKTALLEQFVLPHTRGSSHGQTRIMRKAYAEDFYANMMDETYELWAQLEREAGVKLYRQTGLLVMGPEKSHYFEQVKKTLQRNRVPMVTLTSDNFNQHIPHVKLTEGDGAVVEVTAGVLYADRALKAAQAQFQKLGGVIRDNEMVTDIKPGPIVTVSTSAGVYRAKRVVITAGPWANRLLAHTGLQLPLEICYHAGSKADPDQRDQQTDRSDIDILQRYVKRCFPGLFPEPAVVESCLYTLTPDRHFVLDCHPTYSNIVIGAGFSGHGFKFGPIIGKLLCELSLGEVPSYDLSPFRIRRFQANTKSAL
ncbi:peroxisomal sarcosine oxidase isoform X2 [Acanthochromis polyacanthus]|uniref:peroxisomal sarcosine oxidase isoform X2 n=1 Tax=Acanthochromis polyacanthus TaxID=80966 RepID=UPI002234C0C8|nr:peroxisomal sarcosine oxidase isoform X2 [Acanthochromis polyacanthus]